MTISFQSNLIQINGVERELPWPILSAVEEGDKIFVLLDPNSYLSDPEYLEALRQGSPSIRNLIGFDKNGQEKWQAELPGSPDYYYQIVSLSPLIVDSFSSHRCEIDPQDGKISRREFLK